jgi:RNA polymerase sigma factor (sigma-70 family)
MERHQIEQAVTDNLGLIRGVIIKTLKKYGAKLCPSDVEDIESNTVLCLLDGRLDNYRQSTEKKMQQWIGYIAMQRCIDYLRGIKKNVSLHEEGDDESPSKLVQEIKSISSPDDTPEQAYLYQEFQLARRARLRAAVATLSEDDQGTFRAMRADGYTTRSYAQAEGIKESSVHTRRHRLVKNLRKCL